MKVSTKQFLIIAGIVLVVFIIIGIWFYRKGKKQTTIAPLPLDNPDANNAYGVSFSELLQIADAMHKDMDGLNLLGHDVTPYEKYAALSDTDFVKVYNVYNEKYQKESGETLKEWIESESYAFDDVTDSILARMGRLNLK